MPRRYFNWKLAIVLLIGLVVLGVTAYGLRQWRRSTRSESGLILGNKAYDEHRYEEAASQLGRYLAVERTDVPILLKYANARLNIRPLKSNNVQQAIAAYQAALREDKNNSEAAVKLTEIYLGSKGMAGEAELIATRYLETNKDLKLSRLLAIALARQGKFGEAATELKNIIAEHPDQILAYETLGQLTEQRPQDFPDSASFLFDEAVKNNPSSALAFLIRAAFHLRNEDKVEVLADLERAEKLDLSDSIVRLRLAAEFINANVFDKAEEHLEAVQAAEPKNQALWQIWSRLALKSRSKAMMLKVADNGLNGLSFQPWDFMPTAAELYIRCDELDRASDCISKLSQKGIAPPITVFLESLLADREGHLSKAAKCFRLAIQSGNKSPQVRLALASTLSRSGDTQSALRQLRTLVSERPTLFDGRLHLARLLAQMESWTETAEQARMARQISPNSLDAALLHTQAQMQLLAASPKSENAQMWQDIEDQLAALEKATDNAFPVKTSQFQLALFRSQFSKAQQLLNDMKNSHPSRREVAMAEVKLLIAQNKTDEAIAKLYDVVIVFPESISPVRYLAILLAAKDKNQDCESIIKDALTRIEHPVVKRELGLLLTGFYSRWNEHEKCYQFLDSFARDLSDDILIQRELLRCENVLKDSDRAQQLVNKIKTIEGEDGWQWRYEQARIWLAQDNFKNRYPRIISLLKENLLAYPDDQNSRILLARNYGRAGQLPLAISIYRQAYDRSPQDLRIIVPYVKALRKAKEYDRADEILRRVDSEKLFHPELKKFQLQRCLVRGELDSAIDILENLLANDPNNRSDSLSLALLKMRQNKFAEVGELLIRLKIQDPNSLQVKVAQIELNVRQGKSAEAILLCDEIINNLNNASAYILRAKTFDSLGEPNKAIVDFDKAITIEPNNVEAWVAKSDFYRSIDKLEKAIADIQQALFLAPGNLQVQKRAILLLLASNRPDRVLQGRTILDKALTTNPQDIGLRLYQARSLIAEGTAPAFEKAEGILQKITKDQPKFSPAWVQWGELSLKQGEYGEARDIAWRGLAHTPNDKGLLLLKFRAEKEQSLALAIPTLELLYETGSYDVDSAVLLANTYIEAEKYEKAVNLLRKQLASYSDSADERKVKIALVRALYKNGDKTEFQKEFDSLLQSAPDDPGPLLAQVLLLKDDKFWSRLNQKTADWCRDHPEDSLTPVTIAGELATTEDIQAKKIAEDLLRDVLANHPNSLPAMNTLALLLQITGRPAESAVLYGQILTIQPDNVKAINNLAWILCENQGKRKEALKLAERGLKIAPNYIDLIDTRGVIYYRIGQFEKARQDFNNCLKLYPKGTLAATTTHFHLGRALIKIDQKDGAINNLNRALELSTEIGGLSIEDAAETQRMIDQLSLGG
ncbi:MAG: tetratricopeptide repeat protein [Planctomycetes bacterium]|nr:tetratricopeptide repeat protein [Planctomycetota bacterium]